MLELGQSPGVIHSPAFARSYHRLPCGPGNGGFVAGAPLSECTRKAETWTVYKEGQCAKWCHMQQLGPERLHQSLVSSRTHSQWTLWGLRLGRRYYGHDGSQPDQHWEGLPLLRRFSAGWCVPAAWNIRSGAIWVGNLQQDVDLCQVLARLWSSLVHIFGILCSRLVVIPCYVSSGLLK